MKNEKSLTVRDWLALERTSLANERTLLSYLRTAFVLFGTGIGIYKIELFEDVQYIGVILMVAAPIFLLVGIFRFFKVKKAILKNYS